MPSDRNFAQPTDGDRLATHHRQILAMLGNRTVVFGMPQDDGKALSFTPETDSVIRPRVASKNEISEQNILDTLKAAGFALKQAEPSDNGVDLEMTGDSGEKVVVEVKVRDGVPSRRELELVEQELRRLAAHESSSELWRFSRDELQLDVYALVDGKVQHERLVPLNVWEATREGIFERSKVLERVSDWERRLRALYDEISRWTADSNSVTTEQSRTVTMSEELMRNFAVPDRELPILDIARGDEPIASLVPRALWIIGANGRVDLITKSGTRILVDVCEEPWGWKLVDLEDRRKMLTFDKAALWALLGGV